MKKTLLIAGVILLPIFVASCSKTDNTSTAERAKNLKKDMERTVDKVKEGIADKTQERAQKSGIGDANDSDASVDDGNEGADKETHRRPPANL